MGLPATCKLESVTVLRENVTYGREPHADSTKWSRNGLLPVWPSQNFITSPELRTRNEVEKAVAIVARDAVQARILHQEVELTERATDKYGRLLANVYYRGDQHEPELGQWLLTQRLAVPYDGGTKTVVDNWQLYHQSASTSTLSSPR